MMSDFERDYLVAYHWSPSTRRDRIAADGLLIGSEPCVNAAEGDEFRNTCISLSPTPSQAWWLSGQAIHAGGFNGQSPIWDLYEVDIAGLKADRRDDDYPEIKVRENIPADRGRHVAVRQYGHLVYQDPRSAIVETGYDMGGRSCAEAAATFPQHTKRRASDV